MAARGEPVRARLWPGLFVVLEGGEGSGKSTQVPRLAAALREAPYRRDVMETREPGGTGTGARIREMVLGEVGLSVRAEALLFAADRAQHMMSVVPFLERGWVVVSDRHAGSQIAYQGAGRELGEEWIRRLSLWASYGVVPDVTVLLDVPVKVGLKRARGRGVMSRIDKLDAAFHERVRESLLRQAQAPGWVVVPGTAGEDEVAALVEAAVAARLEAV